MIREVETLVPRVTQVVCCDGCEVEAPRDEGGWSKTLGWSSWKRLSRDEQQRGFLVDVHLCPDCNERMWAWVQEASAAAKARKVGP